MDNISNKLSQQIRQKALQLKRLNHAIKTSLPVDCHPHLEVAGIRENQLVILTDSPVWQTRLRMYSQSMLEALQQHLGIKLTQVKFRLSPVSRQIPEEPPVARHLSASSAEVIQQTANCLEDEALSSALNRLASKAKKP